MYMYIYIYVYVYIYIYVYVYIYICICVYIYICVCIVIPLSLRLSLGTSIKYSQTPKEVEHHLKTKLVLVGFMSDGMPLDRAVSTYRSLFDVL